MVTVSGSSLGLLLSLLLGGLGLFMLVLAGAFLLVLLLGAGYRDTQVAGQQGYYHTLHFNVGRTCILDLPKSGLFKCYSSRCQIAVYVWDELWKSRWGSLEKLSLQTFPTEQPGETVLC